MNHEVGGFSATTFLCKYPPDQLHRSVKPDLRQEGVYYVYYRHDQVIDEYGPDVEKAVPRYMEDKGLLPSECQYGIEVIGSGGNEVSAIGITAFRCRYPPDQLHHAVNPDLIHLIQEDVYSVYYRLYLIN